MPTELILLENNKTPQVTQNPQDERVVIALPQINESQYFPRCEFYFRAPHVFSGMNLDFANTYARSSYRRRAFFKKNPITFSSRQPKTDPAKEGTYENALRYFPKNLIQSIQTERLKVEASTNYDSLLQFHKKNAQYVLAALSQQDGLKINADNGYPAVLVQFPLPQTEHCPSIKDDDWTNFSMILLVATINHLSQKEGINIETIYRSSFATLQPSVAECLESIRINLGLSPKPYLDVVIQSILLVQEILKDPKRLMVPNILLKNKLQATYNDYYKSQDIVAAKQMPDNIFEILFSAGDAKGKSVLKQLLRYHGHILEITANMQAAIALLIKNLSKQVKKKKGDLVENHYSKLLDVFVSPLSKASLEKKSASDKKVKITYKKEAFEVEALEWHDEKQINDDYFWNFVAKLGQTIDMPECLLKHFQEKKTTTHLHACFFYALKEFNFKKNRPIDELTDGYGSDSDTEEEINYKNKSIKIRGLKLVTATGMRAILLAEYAARAYLIEKHGKSESQIKSDVQLMYYETKNALKHHAIQYIPEVNSDSEIDEAHDIDDNDTPIKLALLDLNHCNRTHQGKGRLNLLQRIQKLKPQPIIIIDTTSATTEEIGQAIFTIFTTFETVKAILTVSSGLKNEQSMSDYNHYGTVRVFAKDPAEAKFLRDFMTAEEDKVKYKHPAHSHQLRLTHKFFGFTPVNQAILLKAKSKDDSVEQLQDNFQGLNLAPFTGV